MATIKELEGIVRRLEEAEGRAASLRKMRNRAIFELVREPEEGREALTERAAARVGKVSPVYAHRCVAGEGVPATGPALDAARAAKPKRKRRRPAALKSST